MKNVISFSLWGDNPFYVQGALENILLAKILYPSWICRFYVDQSITEAFIDKVKKLGAEVIIKTWLTDCRGLFWRFEAAFDPTVSRCIIRDCDSRLSQREALAVAEWTRLNTPFHIMRDHLMHGVPILGGMWGIIGNRVPEFKERYIAYTQDIPIGDNTRGPYFGADQFFLADHIWPLIRNNHTAHDEFFTYTGKELPFPTERHLNYFVGQPMAII